MYTIRKEFTFEAAHCLQQMPEGHPCRNNHGHSYKVVIELRAQTLNQFGMVRDYRDFGTIKAYLDEMFDHAYLNDIISLPTAENIAHYLFNVFHPQFPELFAVEVCETAKTVARYEKI
jgi:6-pyruvoyltetrahydropterin/6-carboxytetrahydropterin synthase